MATQLFYQAGFGNQFSTEARAGALPQGQNSPQKAPFGLYAEQLSGSSFLSPRHENLRSWLYRLRPAVVHGHFTPLQSTKIRTAPCSEAPLSPEQMRWNPQPLPQAPTDFIGGLVTAATAGNALEQKGLGVHWYSCNQSMKDTFFYSADGEWLIVPEQGILRLVTELGVLEVEPKEIAVIPRGIRFRVEVTGPSRGYVCENHGPALRLPQLGPIGANGLANPRDFLYPTAGFENLEGKF
ncbi:homogentisate 1,2-dioxygenase, partial [bacterium]|nr:homogentisate 1,2-dioxygenase [bacterium]